MNIPPTPDNLIIYQTDDGKSQVALMVADNEAWLSQNQLAELFATSVPNVATHIKNIIEDKELDESSVIKDYLITAQDNKQYQVKHYSLDMILAVGFRVRSARGAQFRRWANTVLRGYLDKGFLLDKERLKNPQGRADYFDELLAEIREIRASEMRFYQKVRELFSLSSDYDKTDKAAQMFFAETQNKLIYAVTRQTAAELVIARADARKPNMGLTAWKGRIVRKGDIVVAKNYLNADELDSLNRLVMIFLESAELRVKNRQDLTLDFWRNNVDALLEFNGFSVLDGKGSRSHRQMEDFAAQQYSLFEQARKLEKQRLADEEDLQALEILEKDLQQKKTLSKENIMTDTTPIAETNHFIVLEQYEKIDQSGAAYQTEKDLESELIRDLQAQGYEYRRDLNTHEKLLANVREQLQKLNHAAFSDAEWARFVAEYLDRPFESLIEKTRKVHDDYICDFVFDNGRIQNIYLFDKKNTARNAVQVINQFGQTGTHANRYDVTVLVNGLPLVQVELKKRGVKIREAFNQVHRYTKESFNTENSLFKYLQIFVISNGTDTRYFANTTRRDKNSFDFTMNWARANNDPIKDLKDFTATFFQKNTLLSVLLHYSVFDAGNTLLIMRPYQIAAAERILWKIKSSAQAKNWSNTTSGGYIWHTTGSGKTLTSFKAARLATELDFIDKVFFVVDRKDLDYQTMKEYQRFSPDSVNGSNNTAGLKRNLEKDDNKIIVTTIQKLNNLMKSEESLPAYHQQVVFIFDECHRSQFGEAQKNLKKKFKKFCQFGFTGTPIFPDEIVNGRLVRKGNALGAESTGSVFGQQLHSYIITDAIRDEKVLKFKVDYNDVRPQFKSLEQETDEAKLTAAENRQALLHPERIREITQYILAHFKQKTGRNNPGGKGFNAMFAVSSVEAAKAYYAEFKKQQAGAKKPLKVATIFSFAGNEEQNAAGDIADESFEVSALNASAKEFLNAAIADYNACFKTSFSTESSAFQNYYRDLSLRVKKQEVDLLIVVGMFLTGFDAPTLNTLFVDKNLRYHGLMQAFSRTNRIYDATKTFGNIVTFRDLEQATIDAITLFGDKNTKNVILEKSFDEYMEGYTDPQTGEARRGYLALVQQLRERFPDPDKIETEKDKKEFAKLFGEYLRAENVLQHYDEFAGLQALQKLDTADEAAVAEFKEKFYLSDEDFQAMQNVPVLPERAAQDYRSAYNDIRDWLRREQSAEQQAQSAVDWDDVVFEVDLLKSQEINLDYILELLFEYHKKIKNTAALIEEIRRLIRSSLNNRAKESLMVDFIEQTDLDSIPDKASVIDAFYQFARGEQKREAETLITEENLKPDEAKRYLATSLKRGYANENGTELNGLLPKISPLNPKYLTLKKSVFEKISDFVEKFKDVGGSV